MFIPFRLHFENVFDFISIHWNEPNVVCEDFDLLSQACLLPYFLDLVKCVAHDGNQHVESCDLSDKGWDCKENPNKSSVRRLSTIILWEEVVQIVISKSNQVLIDDWIDSVVYES